MSNWRNRTAEEREAARLERERKRTGKSGPSGPARAPEPEPAPVVESAAREDDAAVRDPAAREDDAAVRDPAAREDDAAVGDPSAREDDAAVSDPAARKDDAAVRDPAPAPAPAPGLVAVSADPDGSERVDRFEDEAPAGTRRVAGIPQSRAQRQRPARRPHRSRRPGAAPGKGHSRLGRVISVVALAIAAVVIWFLVQLFQPFHASGQGRITVTIPPHSSSSQVGDLLARDGVISSSFFFELRATLAGERSNLRAGTYHLARDMSYGGVLSVLTTAPPPAKVTDLTITEGRTRREIDALLRSQGIHGSYLGQTRHSKVLRPSSYGAPSNTPSLEGFLFPSTYQLRDPISLGALVTDQLQTFRQRFAHLNLGYASSRHLTPYEVLIIASMVEAEAQTERDRPLIASVIYNRLAAGMPLQIDATTRYATGNYTSPLTVSQLSSPSPYNTRIHKGLPPTPIDNPGLASIEAAAHPAATNYLYFVVKPCANGEQAFTGNYQQFLALAQQYQTARARRGGRSPVHC